MKKKELEWDGLCEYCGGAVSKAKPSAALSGTGSAKYIHYECELKRDWMLRCIRHSHKLAEYVVKTEAREKDSRELRAKEMQAKKTNEISKKASQHELPESLPFNQPTEHDRIARLEKMIEKLTSALGGL